MSEKFRRNITPTYQARGDEWFVSAKEEETGYMGPEAVISYDENWLHITTDPYEGHVMLNIETLPALLRALKDVTKRLQSVRTPGAPPPETGDPT